MGDQPWVNFYHMCPAWYDEVTGKVHTMIWAFAFSGDGRCRRLRCSPTHLSVLGYDLLRDLNAFTTGFSFVIGGVECDAERHGFSLLISSIHQAQNFLQSDSFLHVSKMCRQIGAIKDRVTSNQPLSFATFLPG